jgi:DNA-directed RNA polymerase I subunit RPA43
VENEPEYGAGAGEENGMEVDGDGTNETEEADSGGKWIHRITADVLAEKERVLEFTVIGCVPP